MKATNSNKHHGNLGHSKTDGGYFPSEELARQFCKNKMLSGKWEKFSVSFDKTPNLINPYAGRVTRSPEFCANLL